MTYNEVRDILGAPDDVKASKTIDAQAWWYYNYEETWWLTLSNGQSFEHRFGDQYIFYNGRLTEITIKKRD